MTRPGVWSTGARRSFATRSLSARTQTLFESDVGYLRSIARPLAKAVQPEPQGIVQKFMAAWRIFFPERPNDSTPKEEGKNRLRMILVADRCGEGGFVGVYCVGGSRTYCVREPACSLARFLDPRRCGITPASLSHMRESIVKAVSDYVDIETEEEIEVCAVMVVRRLGAQGCRLVGGFFSERKPALRAHPFSDQDSVSSPRTGQSLHGSRARYHLLCGSAGQARKALKGRKSRRPASRAPCYRQGAA